jgi:hypothetical protein
MPAMIIPVHESRRLGWSWTPESAFSFLQPHPASLPSWWKREKDIHQEEQEGHEVLSITFRA